MSADVIVIGGGHNGLAAALHLATRGWKPLVLEQAPVCGGAVKTAEVTLPGFRHDLYAMNLNLFAGSPFHAEHGALLARHGLAFAGTDRPFASVFAPGSPLPWLGLQQGLEATLAQIGRASAHDARAWRALDARFEREMPHLFGLLGTPVPSWALLKLLYKAGRALGLNGAMETVRLLLSSPRAFLDAHFESDAVKAFLAAWGMHLDYAPDIAGGALFPYLEAMAGQRFGMALGQGGADVMIRSLVSALESLGGEVRCNARVERITVESGRATGVTLADGGQHRALRAVIANVHPRALYGPLLGQAAPARSASAARLRPGPGTMMIHLAVSQLPQWLAGPQLQQWAYVHVAPSTAQMAATYQQAQAGLLPAEPVLVVGQPTAVDPSRAPDGQHILWIQVRALPARVHGDALGQIPAGGWDGIKAAYADRVLALLERYAPGTRASILGQCVLSPDDLERDNPNLVGGDSLSGSHHLDQFFLLRPAFGFSRWRTGVDQLFHIGASTWPGAGTGAGSGYMLARALAA